MRPTTRKVRSTVSAGHDIDGVVAVDRRACSPRATGASWRKTRNCVIVRRTNTVITRARDNIYIYIYVHTKVHRRCTYLLLLRSVDEFRAPLLSTVPGKRTSSKPLRISTASSSIRRIECSVSFYFFTRPVAFFIHANANKRSAVGTRYRVRGSNRTGVRDQPVVVVAVAVIVPAPRVTDLGRKHGHRQQQLRRWRRWYRRHQFDAIDRNGVHRLRRLQRHVSDVRHLFVWDWFYSIPFVGTAFFVRIIMLLTLCVGVYDGGERAPKLLPCSHTVCVHCLTRIVAAANNRRTALDTSLNNARSNGSGALQQQDHHLAAAIQQRQTFRCPICREQIVVPQNGGVAVLPPSFLVNQLLDLISTHRRRTLIPTCCGGGILSSHVNQVFTITDGSMFYVGYLSSM